MGVAGAPATKRDIFFAIGGEEEGGSLPIVFRRNLSIWTRSCFANAKLILETLCPFIASIAPRRRCILVCRHSVVLGL